LSPPRARSGPEYPGPTATGAARSISRL
jgi:hypothetical protein